MSNIVGAFFVGLTMIGEDPDSDAFGAVASGRSVVRGSLFTRRTVRLGTGNSTGSSTMRASMTVGVSQGLEGQADGISSLHSHISGRHPYDGPAGSVNLSVLAAGDLGTAEDVLGQSTVGANLTLTSARLVQLFGNAGVSVDRSLVAQGTAAGGSETKQTGAPAQPQQAVTQLSPYYV